MNCDPGVGDENSIGEATAVANKVSCDVEPAPLVDVMFDQMEYLLSHGSRHCPPACEDCARLVEVRKVLLRPFALAA